MEKNENNSSQKRKWCTYRSHTRTYNVMYIEFGNGCSSSIAAGATAIILRSSKNHHDLQFILHYIYRVGNICVENDNYSKININWLKVEQWEEADTSCIFLSLSFFLLRFHSRTFTSTLKFNLVTRIVFNGKRNKLKNYSETHCLTKCATIVIVASSIFHIAMKTCNKIFLYAHTHLSLGWKFVYIFCFKDCAGVVSIFAKRSIFSLSILHIISCIFMCICIGNKVQSIMS